MTNNVETPVAPVVNVTVKKSILQYARNYIHFVLKLALYPLVIVLHVVNSTSAKALTVLYKF